MFLKLKLYYIYIFINLKLFIMKNVFWTISLILDAIAALYFLAVVTTAESAPQQAAGAGIALCIAIIPYIFSRSITEMGKK